MKIKFLGQAYESRAPTLASQTLVNLYLESSEGEDEDEGSFYGTPGYEAVFSGIGEVRGLHSAGGSLYAVIGSSVWKSNGPLAPFNLGSLPNATGKVSMIHNETQVAIAHQDGWHWIAFNGVSVAPVAGAPGSSILTYQDEYGLYTDTGGLFGITALADLSTLDPLDVADAESQPDNLVAILSLHKEAWLFGEETIEPWDNTGAALFPWEPSPGSLIEQGCCAPFSIAKMDNGAFWLGRDSNGQGIVYRSMGYQPIRISTHPIEFMLNSCSSLATAFCWSYQEEGHSFYCLTVPDLGDGTGDFTFAYDVATKKWHRRGWLDSQGTLHRHRANCYATFNGHHFIGDFENGSVYRMSLDAYTDNGDAIYRERSFDIPDSEQKKVRIDLFELYATTGDGQSTTGSSSGTADSTATVDSSDTVDSSSITTSSAIPQVWLQISKDSGRKFGYKRIIGMGAVGQTLARARWRRLGTGRNMVVRVGTTMTNRVEWVSGLMNAEVLSQ